MSLTTGWKILDSNFRPPIQGGAPLFDGHTFPTSLPPVLCDSSDKECSFGYNFVRDIETGFKIAGLWLTGRSNAIIAVEADEAYRRGDKLRAPSLNLLRHASKEEVRAALGRFSLCFGKHAEAMAEEQWLWYQALGRPLNNRAQVVVGLETALEARELKWTLKEFPSARDARDAWDGRDAPPARASSRDAWASRDARDARASSMDARDARDALTVSFAARSAWTTTKHHKLTVGIRDAYYNGLAIALPTGPNELGWAMETA